MGYSLGDTYVGGLAVPVHYASGNYEGYMVDVPYFKAVLESEVPGKNQSRMVAGSFIAAMHPVQGFVVGITRFWYLPALVAA